MTLTAAPPVPLRRALTFSAFGTAATRVVGAAGGVAVARALHPGPRGDLAVLIVVASIVSLVGAAGLQFWIAREVARTDSMRGPDAVVMVHVIALSAAIIAIALLVAPWIVPDHVGANAFAGTVAYAVTGAICFAALALPNGLRCMGVVAGAVLASSTIYFVGALALLVTGTASVAAVLWFATLGNIATVAVVGTFWWHRRDAVGPASTESVSERWRGGLRFGAAGGAGELVLFAMFRVDFLIAAAFLPLADVGVYAVATALSELLWVVPDGVAQVLLPTGARSPDAGGFAPIFRLSLAVTVVVACGAALLAGPAIDLVFGTPYAGAAGVVPYLAIAAVAGGAWKMIAADVAARDRTGPRLTSALVGLTVMVGFDLLFIPRFGIRGAGGAAALGYCAAVVAIGRAWHQATGIDTRTLFHLRATDLHLVRHPDAASGVAS